MILKECNLAFSLGRFPFLTFGRDRLAFLSAARAGVHASVGKKSACEKGIGRLPTDPNIRDSDGALIEKRRSYWLVAVQSAVAQYSPI